MPDPHVTTIPPATAHDEPALEFPGCRPVRMSRDDIEHCERRIEYWDAATETAMICDPVSVYHEHPGQRLRDLATRIAQLRGSPIETYGAADLLQRDAGGAWLRILEADQTVYLHPRTTRPPGARIEVGTDTLPDVVLEVDNTTDVRRGKLSLYESWGFPEVWVEVPEESSPSRPAGLRPGLTIHLLEGGAFRGAAQSRAFAGWTAAEIHRALNEPELSQATLAALRRVARALGAAEGTGPDDDPQLHAERRESRAQGHAAGHAEGHAAGHAEGHAAGHAEGHAAGYAEGLVEGATEARVETRRDAVLQVLRLRGLPVSAAFPRRLAELQPASTATLVQAALECRDEAHFLGMIRQPRP